MNDNATDRGADDALREAVEPVCDEAADASPCDCERAGPFRSGVPGILAQVADGQIAPDATVERCDQCGCYPSDEAARRQLIERGLLPDAAPPTYTVHGYVTVRIVRRHLAAGSPRDAARQAAALFEDGLAPDVEFEFVPEFTEFLVDVDGDEERLRSRRFDEHLRELGPATEKETAMDPQAAWRELRDAYAGEDWERVRDLATGLLAWLERGGFPPETGGADEHRLGEAWNRAVTEAACRVALETAERFAE